MSAGTAPTPSNENVDHDDGMPRQIGDRLAGVEAIAALAHGFSLEATRPDVGDVAALAGIVPAGMKIYVSAVPTRAMNEVIDAAARLRRAGFEPVPHLAVRNFSGTTALDDFLARLSAEAQVRRLLVIAGDRDPPVGTLRAALEVIDGGPLKRHGLTEVGIAGYPDGHPRIAQQDLDRALVKISAAAATGLAIHIVTQFCFDATAIVRWITRLRDFGIDQPVRIGLAGPTSLATLLRFAKRCGVRASAQGLVRQAGLVRQLFAMSTPDALLRELGQQRPQLGDVATHFFTFGGLALTARWAAAVAEGRVTLEANGGFQVEPPRQSR